MYTKKITILLVDDHEVVRQGLRAYLESQPDFRVIAEVSSGEEAVEAATEYLPDVVLMDLVMMGIGGVEATRRVKDLTPRTQVVVLTSYHQDEFIFPALRAGAISYVLKDVMMDDLAEAIRKAARGEAVLHPRVAERVIQEINGAKGATFNPFTELTNREMEVLRLIARGMCNSLIAEELYISENTVKGHVSNILSKLQLADRTQAAVYAWEQGIVHRTE
ncbi:response regulator transcription factor [bacterium]|nr:response regulator transcription factor [bacterium]